MEDARDTVHACGCRVCGSGADTSLVELHQAINRVMGELREKDRRRLAGLLAGDIGRGGIQRLAEITGLSRGTIRRGAREIAVATAGSGRRMRRQGGGRKRLEKKRPEF